MSPPSPPSPAKQDDQASKSTNISPTPLRGTFFRVSGGSSSRSPSPRRRLAKQPVHIRMNLTEGQMDRLTDAFSTTMAETPTRSRTLTSPKSTPRKGKSHTGLRSRHKPSSSLDSITYHEAEDDEPYSATISELMPRMPPNDPLFSSSTLAHRRQQLPPSPLKMGMSSASMAHRSKSIPLRPKFEAISATVSPLSPHRRMRSEPVNEITPPYDESVYSQESPRKEYISPKKATVPSSRYSLDSAHVNDAVLNTYHAWGQKSGYQTPMIDPTPTSPPPIPERTVRPRRSKTMVEHVGTTSTTHPATIYGQEGRNCNRPGLRSPIKFRQDAEMPPSTPFSPFPFYFRGEGQVTKKGEKKLIGEDGWLGGVDQAKDAKDRKKPQPKKPGFLDSIKRIAKDMTELSSRPTASSKQPSRTPQIQISLSAREQSLLYCELEYHLTTILNDYITRQLHRGLLSPTHLARISTQWQSLGRPRVVAFRYDLETQLDLIILHVRDFQFQGRRQGNVVELGGVLESMKANARQMRVRTFCAPDSVVAKQLIDAQALCEVVGAEGQEGRMIGEVVQFFRVCVERERLLKA